MAKRKKEPAEETAAEDRRRLRDTVSQVAHALRHRDEIVLTALEFLEGSGFLDTATRLRVQATYEAGDTATRMAVQDLLSRVLRVPLDQLDEQLQTGQVDPARISTAALDALEELSLPQVDVAAVAAKVRGFDMEALVERSIGDNKVLRFVTDIPVMLNNLRLGMLFGGIAMLLVVAVALLFPQYALWIAFYGLLVTLALLGGLLVTWAVRLERGSKEFGIDLVVFSRLEPDERRLLVVRRMWLGVVDTRRLGDLVEKSLHAVLPERMRAPQRGRVGPEPKRPRPARPLPRDRAADGTAEQESRR